jgi:hypothetical protein
MSIERRIGRLEQAAGGCGACDVGRAPAFDGMDEGERLLAFALWYCGPCRECGRRRTLADLLAPLLAGEREAVE